MQRIREYETIYIVRPDISNVDTDRVFDRVGSIIREYQGKIVEINNWGKRKLAYEIAKHQKGIYFHWRYVGDNSCVAEIERNLRLLEPVIRFLTVKLKEAVDPDAYTDLPSDYVPRRTQPAEGADGYGRGRDGADSKPAPEAGKEKEKEKEAAPKAEVTETSTPAAEAKPADESKESEKTES